MADDITPHGDEQDTATQGAPEEKPEKVEIDWKAEARKHEARSKENLARAKANEDAARRLKEFEDAQKTEAEKTAERLAALEAENTAYKRKEQLATWAAEVAEATNVPAELLRGGTKEELEAHAAQLQPVLAAPQQPVPPTPVPTVGQQPQTPGNVSLPEQIAAAEAAGNKELVAALKAVQLGG